MIAKVIPSLGNGYGHVVPACRVTTLTTLALSLSLLKLQPNRYAIKYWNEVITSLKFGPESESTLVPLPVS
jgi:hypothetical protein